MFQFFLSIIFSQLLSNICSRLLRCIEVLSPFQFHSLGPKVSRIQGSLGPRVSRTQGSLGPKVFQDPRFSRTQGSLGPKVSRTLGLQDPRSLGPKVSRTQGSLGPKVQGFFYEGFYHPSSFTLQDTVTLYCHSLTNIHIYTNVITQKQVTVTLQEGGRGHKKFNRVSRIKEKTETKF